MHASLERYAGQPNPGARLPLPVGRKPLPILRTTAEHLATLRHGFLLDDAMIIVSWPGTKLQLARYLQANGFTRRIMSGGSRYWFPPEAGK